MDFFLLPLLTFFITHSLWIYLCTTYSNSKFQKSCHVILCIHKYLVFYILKFLYFLYIIFLTYFILLKCVFLKTLQPCCMLNADECKIGFPFAKPLRNFCERKRKILLLMRYIFAGKIAICAIIRNFAEQISSKSCWIKMKTDYLTKTLFCNLHDGTLQIKMVSVSWRGKPMDKVLRHFKVEDV